MTTRDDDLLAMLGKAGREGLDVSADRRWDALAQGDLSVEDAAALEEMARLSEKGREAFEAFRPIDEAARAKMAEAVMASLATKKAEPANDGVVALPQKKRRVGAIVLAASLAAAAAFALMVRSGKPAPLPAYAMTVTGEREERGDPVAKDPPVRLGPGARLRIVLRPDRRVEGPIAVRGFVAREGRWSTWSVTPEVARDGAVLIVGAREDLFPGAKPGLFAIAVAVGRSEDLPSDPDGAGDAVRVMRARVEIHDGGGP